MLGWVLKRVGIKKSQKAAGARVKDPQARGTESAKALRPKGRGHI